MKVSYARINMRLINLIFLTIAMSLLFGSGHFAYGKTGYGACTEGELNTCKCHEEGGKSTKVICLSKFGTYVWDDEMSPEACPDVDCTPSTTLAPTTTTTLAPTTTTTLAPTTTTTLAPTTTTTLAPTTTTTLAPTTTTTLAPTTTTLAPTTTTTLAPTTTTTTVTTSTTTTTSTLETSTTTTFPPNFVTTGMNTAYTFQAPDFTSFDGIDESDFNGIKLMTEETTGDLEYDKTDAVVGNVYADVTKLIFMPDPDSCDDATFTFLARDNADELSDATYTLTVNVDIPPGDIDCSCGEPDLRDLILAFKILAETDTGDTEICNADVNDDGKIGFAEIFHILKTILHTET
ncbi:hypothetical protein [Desulfonema magnum]|uniref:EF-hand domain-containing protein n=1 Tax=Desulfonema magnum TaxID=45655 RepID=A0A975BN04_9BACT|nr:hypothetical protein [Desulfonema magnum]QTA87999.1 Uncharacterized protein dnm_040390 [Desulfonema magnum]